jgi:hypothetical protein
MDRRGEFDWLSTGLQKDLLVRESSTKKMRDGDVTTTFTENGRLYTE